MNSSPASSYALRLELLDAVGEPGGDLAHAVRVDLDPGVLHRREHRGQRQLDLAVERLARRARGRARASGRAGAASRPAWRTRAAVSSSAVGLGDQLEAVLGGEVVELVAGAARARSGTRAIIVSSTASTRERLGVVRDELALERARAGRDDDDLVAGGDGDPAVVGRDPGEPVERRRPAPRATGPSTPVELQRRRGRDAPRRARRRGSAGCGTRSGGTSPSASSGPAARARALPGRSRARGRGASSRAASTRAPARRARGSPSRARARARRRARAPPRASRTARSAGRRSCRRSPGCPGCCRTCRPSEPMKSGTCSGGMP